jgi:hypothetical protein
MAMAKRTFMGITVALALGATAASAGAGRVTGLVTAATDTAVQIRTIGEGETTVSVDGSTGYMKWITHKPWQQDNRANHGSVAAGSCVDVQLRSDAGRVAKSVWINADGAGTLYDPCRGIR